MLAKIVTSSIRFRLDLYIPMLIAIVVSLSLVGSAEIVGKTFGKIVGREMAKYGANVILVPEEDSEVSEGVALFVTPVKLGNVEVRLVSTDIPELLEMNPAWMVKGSGNILVGKSVGANLDIRQESFLEVGETSGRVAILESGTEFDTFIIVNGIVEKPSMVLIRTDDVEKYRDKNAVILEEMLTTKYAFLGSMKKLILYVSLISGLASMAAVVNLVRMDLRTRRKEFGILKALGALQSTLVKIVLTEFAVLFSLSGALAIGVSSLIAWSILTFVVGASPELDLATALYIFSISFLAFGLSSLVYILEFKRRDVVEEIKGD
jgi:hypothetical protein